MFIGGMKYVKTQTGPRIYCLEPLYGIILAGILIHEVPDFGGLTRGVFMGTVFLRKIKDHLNFIIQRGTAMMILSYL